MDNLAEERIRFGPSGISKSFYEQGLKGSVEMPAWLSRMGLSAYEYSFGRGINMSDALAADLGERARSYGIAMSIHAPYYINLANPAEDARAKSRQYIVDSVQKAILLGARRVVVHTGGCAGRSRAEAQRFTMAEIEKLLGQLDSPESRSVLLCPETMGKPNQQGTLDEIIQICKMDTSRLIPTIDFGHINALGQGCLKTKTDFERIIDAIAEGLSEDIAAKIHVHFSHIEYGKSGEVKHLTMDDEVYGPDFEPLAQVFAERRMHPVVICESREEMAEDALKMKQIYEKACCAR